MALDINAIWERSAGATSYKVEVRVNSGAWTEYVVTDNSFYLAGFNIYDFVEARVRGINDVGQSEWGDIDSLTILGERLVLFATTVSSTQIRLDWNPIADIDYYHIERSINSVDWTEIDVVGFMATFIQDSGLSPNTRYYYRIRHRRGSIYSAYSDIVSDITLITTPVATGATSVTAASFEANWNPVSGRDSYRVDVSTVSNFASFVAGYEDVTVNTLTSLSVTGLTENTTYYYRVRAVKDSPSYTTANSNVITQKTLSILPDPPTGLTVENTGSETLNCNWNASSGATYYVYQYNVDGGVYSSWTNNGNSTFVNIGGFTNGDNVCVRVRACNTNGCSLLFPQVCVVVGPPP